MEPNLEAGCWRINAPEASMAAGEKWVDAAVNINKKVYYFAHYSSKAMRIFSSKSKSLFAERLLISEIL